MIEKKNKVEHILMVCGWRDRIQLKKKEQRESRSTTLTFIFYQMTNSLLIFFSFVKYYLYVCKF